jgi:hypothetical protein
MQALLVVSLIQAKKLVAIAIANRLRHTTKRVYIAYGSTNQLILNELGIDTKKYYNGYISDNELKSNKDKPSIIVLNNTESNIKCLNKNDIVVKGANALVYEHNRYKAAVAVASSEGGTYANVITKASCIGSQVIIPVTHEKLVPKIYNNVYPQNSFDISMGLPITLFEYSYGEVYTEINAFKELYNLNTHIYIAGSLDGLDSYLTFVAEGKEEDILAAKQFIDNCR